jgi:hypothetical protein
VRVSAANSQGYGATTASAPSSLNPNQQSSFPSAVRLAVTSDTMLTVGFDLPADDGGDKITGFRVEWDISLTFNSNLVGSPNKGVVDLDAAVTTSYTITRLTLGPQLYNVRVFARNSAGLGLGTFMIMHHLSRYFLSF